ncbi:UDP-glycosyltransferase 73C3 [Apostasia shenzhenica]|uniref:Glycosyltransferase n=1 Tax=Apostasia shenzhenica TaxID=1088818 RepID=A0A2I0AEU7_9ASPA|nr:UDP-glycosyltransferase 73C3 [Apostasia shenzhenica]
MSSKTEETPCIHFLIVPLMAQGHSIPMLDLARLLAGAGPLVTYVTTPVNAARIRPIIDSTVFSGLSIRFPELRFPATDVGLPDGCENIDLVPSFDLYIPFMKALSLFQNSLKDFLRDDAAAGSPPPSCIISDNFLAWTTPLASSLGVPRLAFHGTSCFFLACTLLLQQHRTEIEGAVTEKESFAIPGLPQAIHVTKSQVSWGSNYSDPEWLILLEEAQAAERGSAGVVVNSFEELEPWYFETYRNLSGKEVWPFGPVSLHKENVETKAARGKASAVDKEHVLEWLNGQASGSVLLVSFGSVSSKSFRQIVELGSGLEAAGWPFIWVVKEAAADSGWPEVEEWVAEFERKVGERGLVIKGWAPQAMILSHAAVGGFMTHCGWNSTLEAIAVGVPMATWPHFADQFLNEKLVVEVLKVGVEIGVEEPTVAFAMEKGSEEVKVGREMVEKAVVRLMDDGEERKERRARARQLGRLAAAAMAEGGSSSENLNNIISYISENDKRKKLKNLEIQKI